MPKAKPFCPTCAAVQAVLQAGRVPRTAARAIAYSDRTRETDQKIRRKAKRILSGQALKQARAMSRHLKASNKKARKKNGSFKKGWSQSRVMREAHRLCKVKR